MNESATDVHQTRTYGTEKIRRPMLWFAAAFVVLGAIGITVPSRAGPRVAWVMAFVGLAWAAYELIFRSPLSAKPLLTLTPQGMTLRTAGEIFIPWREVRGVDSIDVTDWPAKTTPFPVKLKDLTVVAVDRDFYESAFIPSDAPVFIGKAWRSLWYATFPSRQGPTIQVALHHDRLGVEPDVLRGEIAARWYAFRDEDRMPASRPESSPSAPLPAPPAKKVAFRINWGKK